MKTWDLTIPITGRLAVQVEAETEQEAVEIAVSNAALSDLIEWQAHDEISRGNFFFGLQQKYSVDYVEGGEDK